MPSSSWLFVTAVFASAFLIFGVQPMVGKHILPWFGGVPSVWMICLAFYQTALFVGYAWAWALSARVPPRLQPAVHGLLFVASLAVLPVLPGAEWKPEPGADASLRILAMLTANVALPFVLLAATGPLLQVWFARALPGRSPYPLYAVSNLGSLLGLLSFPFLVEPNLALSLQSRVWSWSFGLTGLAVLACSVWAARSAAGPAGGAWNTAEPGIGWGGVALWILFPASAVMLFMGVTNQLCLDVASVPFLWIVPLSIYLITLVLCFGSERIYLRGAFLTLAGVSFAWLMLATLWEPGERFGVLFSDSVGAAAVRYCAALFFGCMVAHGELHRLRPGPARLTAFYLCVAGGGALGGLFVGLLAPRVFDGYHELPLGMAACWGLALVAIARAPTGLFAGRLRGPAWAALLLASAVGVGSVALRAGGSEPGTLAVERNFFGILRVIENPGRTPLVVLRHGTTRHGFQYQNGELRRRPTSYYGQTTGIGLVLARRTRPGTAPARIGVVGLGVGTLSTYGRAGDRIVFYEIDPAVVRIARDAGYFSYLADSPAEIEIVTGDARLSLEAELAQRGSRAFDVLVVDAFTSDAVPLHLLTEQAFRVYAAHLAEEGVLAVHISNRNLDLRAPLARLGSELGLHASVVSNRDAPRLLSEPSRWVVFARDPAYFERLEAEAASLPKRAAQPLTRVVRLDPALVARTPLWTDDFSNVLALLRRPEDRSRTDDLAR
jgi:predicted membrane-bound spermidine synthase